MICGCNDLSKTSLQIKWFRGHDECYYQGTINGVGSWESIIKGQVSKFIGITCIRSEMSNYKMMWLKNVHLLYTKT